MTALFSSCSGGASSSADAGACACPPAEAPLAGRLTTAQNTKVIAAMTTNGESKACPPGAQILSGSCAADTTSLQTINLQQSYVDFANNAWQCEFRNTSTMPVTITVTAICLAPAP